MYVCILLHTHTHTCIHTYIYIAHGLPDDRQPQHMARYMNGQIKVLCFKI